jgi:integrase/recombinase XerD
MLFKDRLTIGVAMQLENFFHYLKDEKKMSDNTLHAYKRDVLEFAEFIGGKGVSCLDEAQNVEVVAYLLDLKNGGKSAATVNRKLASVRALYNYLMLMKAITVNPTQNIKSPRIQRKELEYLTVEDMDKLLSVPDDSTRGIRDKAILELLYATGIRVSELIGANVEDINLRMGLMTCDGEQSKARIIPLGRPARAAVEEYIYDARDKLLKGRKEQALFVNYSGYRITRQGLWKILKEYGMKAEISSKLTPNIIRNSFAVHMMQNGADLKSLQELLGHEDISATQIYLTVTKNRIKDVYDKTHPRA